jgi:hypothetical protein
MVQSKFSFKARFMIYSFFKFQSVLHADNVSNFCATYTYGANSTKPQNKKFVYT